MPRSTAKRERFVSSIGLAVEALLAQGARIQLSEEQKAELKERLGAAEQDLRSALAQAYDRVHVPTGLDTDGSIAFAVRELATVLGAGRGLHERVREALGTHVADKVFPAKVAALAELGDEREWRWAHEVAHALPRYFDAPKVWTPAALRQGIAEAVSQGLARLRRGGTGLGGRPVGAVPVGRSAARAARRRANRFGRGLRAAAGRAGRAAADT